MLRLNQFILFLILWLALFFNLERLHVQKTEVIDIAGPVYVLTVFIVVLGLVLLQYYSISRLTLELIATVLFAVIKVTDRRPIWDDGYTYVTLFEYLSILITGLLTYEVGRRTADFVQTVRMFLFADLQDRVITPQQAAPLLAREIQSSRRTNNPLTVIVVEPQSQDAPIHLTATAREIQDIFVRRYRLVALARLLTRFIRTTDFVLDQSDKGRILFVAPEINRTQVTAVVRRMAQHACESLNVTLNWGSASFPEQGLTLEELVYQAERDLKPYAEGYSTEPTVVTMAPSTEEPHPINASFGASSE